MENYTVVKLRWRKSRSKYEITNGIPICSIYVNENELVSVMAPVEDTKMMRQFALALWAQSLGANLNPASIDDESLKKALEDAGYKLLNVTEEGGTEIFLILKQD